jgi:hypothetical protein
MTTGVRGAFVGSLPKLPLAATSKFAPQNVAVFAELASIASVIPSAPCRGARLLRGSRDAYEAVRFPASETVPVALIRKLVKVRAAELARAKGAKKRR